MQPIWKDYTVSLGSSDAVDFRIVTGGGKVLFTGRSYKRPDKATNTIRINDICSDYLSSGMGAGYEADGFLGTATETFQVQTMTGSSWTTIDTVQFQNDWSYDPGYNIATDGLAFPITTRLDGRQLLVYSAYNVTSVTATVTMKDGSTQQVVLNLSTLGSFNGDYNDDYEVTTTGGTGIAVLPLGDYPNAVSVQIGGITYSVVGDCYQYALYYLNAMGGWDTLLVEGNAKPSADITRYSYQRDYDSSDLSARGTDNYVNEVTRAWELHTGILTNDEASRMHHLLESTKVYLLDIASGLMNPVVLATDAYDVLTFRNGGRTPIEYSITATLAQGRVRQ